MNILQFIHFPLGGFLLFLILFLYQTNLNCNDGSCMGFLITCLKVEYKTMNEIAGWWEIRISH